MAPALVTATTETPQMIDGEKSPHLLRKVAPFSTESRPTFDGTPIKAPLIRRSYETDAPDLIERQTSCPKSLGWWLLNLTCE
jgi:hypothetical protein